MKLQAPIYRAKKIDCDEYIDGYYCDFGEQGAFTNRHAIYTAFITEPIFEDGSGLHGNTWKEIDQSTLSISFDGVNFSHINI